MESICRFGSCCDLHQNRLTGRNLCDTDNIAFVVSPAAVAVVVAVLAVVIAAVHADFAQDNCVAR
jgi:hypothetical protein